MWPFNPEKEYFLIKNLQTNKFKIVFYTYAWHEHLSSGKTKMMRIKQDGRNLLNQIIVNCPLRQTLPMSLALHVV